MVSSSRPAIQAAGTTRRVESRSYSRPVRPTSAVNAAASTRPRTKPVASASRPHSRPAGAAHEVRAPQRKETSKTACFACGKEGHYASDPTCLKYGQPRPAARLHAAREADAEESLDTESSQGVPEDVADQNDLPESENESPLQGDQYSSNDEQELEDYELFEYGDDDEDEHLHALCKASHHIQNEHWAAINNTIKGLPKNHKVWVHKSSIPISRPKRAVKDNRCLMTFIVMNGVRAYALFDSGSTTDALSPEFARVANITAHALKQQVLLQLGTIGSKSRINFGTICKIHIGEVKTSEYFDIVNIDRYDVIIGTVFMRKYGVELDFEHDAIRVQGTAVPALSQGEEQGEIARRHTVRHATDSQD